MLARTALFTGRFVRACALSSLVLVLVALLVGAVALWIIRPAEHKTLRATRTIRAGLARIWHSY